MKTVVRAANSMRKASASPAPKANLAGVVPFPQSEDRFTVFVQIIEVLRDFWPRKTASHISYVTGVSERAVKYWLAGVTRMSIEHVVALLRTEAGFDILEAVMGDSQQEWWLTTKVAHGLRLSRRAIKAQQKRIDELRAQQNQIDLFEK
jgi:hypothetical protein